MSVPSMSTQGGDRSREKLISEEVHVENARGPYHQLTTALTKQQTISFYDLPSHLEGRYDYLFVLYVRYHGVLHRNR